MSSFESENDKRIVDEDWKRQVEKEQASARQQPSQDEDDEGRPLPDASLEALIHMLATQVLAALGLLSGPEGVPEVDRPVAKLMIDMLGVLETKTQGNRSASESEMLDETLYQLRMAYVQMADAPPAPGSSIAQPGKSKIILP